MSKKETKPREKKDDNPDMGMPNFKEVLTGISKKKVKKKKG